jgi:MFS transporter, DHA2 family, integral membrane protein
MGPAGSRLLVPAKDAFMHGIHVTSLISAVITLAGAIVVLAWMPGLRGGAGGHQPAERR